MPIAQAARPRLSWMGFLLLLAACAAPAREASPDLGMGGGMGGGMMARHHAEIPEKYAAVANPIPADDASFARGAAAYTANCAACHGAGGLGDGPAGAALDPMPAPIAHTSLQMGDAYLFWRISEGGAPFSTAMPAWQGALDEQTRWDLINYIRALGQGQVQPPDGTTGATFDPQAEAAQRAAWLAKAVEQKVITAEEARTFERVHAAVETRRAAQPAGTGNSSAAEREAALLAELVETQTITQAQADAFQDIHARLITSGLEP